MKKEKENKIVTEIIDLKSKCGHENKNNEISDEKDEVFRGFDILRKIHLPIDKFGKLRGYGFVEYRGCYAGKAVLFICFYTFIINIS
jgi:RNA recognition motif-containing protein